MSNDSLTSNPSLAPPSIREQVVREAIELLINERNFQAAATDESRYHILTMHILRMLAHFEKIPRPVEESPRYEEWKQDKKTIEQIVKEMYEQDRNKIIPLPLSTTVLAGDANLPKYEIKDSKSSFRFMVLQPDLKEVLDYLDRYQEKVLYGEALSNLKHYYFLAHQILARWRIWTFDTAVSTVATSYERADVESSINTVREKIDSRKSSFLPDDL